MINVLLSRLSKFKPLLPYLLVLPAAFLISQLALDPEPRLRKLILIFCVLPFFLVAKQRLLLFPVLLLIYFPRSMPSVPGVLNSTNGIILVLCSVLFLRSIVEKHSIVSFERMIKNPFFMPSFCIWGSYVLAWLIAYGSNSGGMDIHTEYLYGLTYAMILGNIITGFVKDNASFRYVQLLFLLVLALNLFFGLVFYFKPGLVLIPNIIEDRSVIASDAFRLGGLTFAWEAYAEYLMMSLIIVLGLLSNKVFKADRRVHFGLLALLLLVIVELLLTNTRGAIALTLLGVIIVFLFFTRLPFQKKLALILGSFLIVAVALVIALQTDQLSLVDRMSSFDEMQATEYGYIPADRAGVWLPVIKYLFEEGIMGGSPSYIPLTHWGGSGNLTHWPHNLILLILSTVGLVGLVGFGILVFRIVLMKRTIDMISNYEQYTFYTMLWIALLLFFIDTMKFDGFLRITNSYFYHTWITFAFFFSAANLTDKKRTREIDA